MPLSALHVLVHEVGRCSQQDGDLFVLACGNNVLRRPIRQVAHTPEHYVGCAVGPRSQIHRATTARLIRTGIRAWAAILGNVYRTPGGASLRSS